MRAKFQTTSFSAERQTWIPDWDRLVVALLCAVCSLAGQTFACELSRGKHAVAPNGGVDVASRPKASAQPGVTVGSREHIEMLLAELDPASEQAADAVPVLLVALRNPETDPTVRQRSAAMLGRIGEPARGAVAVLIEILVQTRLPKTSSSSRDQSPSDDETSYWVMKSLGLFGDVAGDAVPAVSRVLTSAASPSKLRVLAADTLGQIRTAASIDVLTTELMKPRRLSDYESAVLRQTIIDSLALAGPLATGAIPGLTRALEDDNADVRRKACDTLGALGPRAEGGMDSLFERLVLDEDDAVKDAAANAIAQVGQPAVEMLVDLLERGGSDLQWRAARALGQTGGAARSVVPKLKNAFGNSSIEVRIEAVDAAWQISRDSNLVAAALVKLLSEDERQVRRRAATLLVELEPLPRETSQELEELAAGDSSNESRTAAYVLRERSRKADQ
jgi:HEAT repeat protein